MRITIAKTHIFGCNYIKMDVLNFGPDLLKYYEGTSETSETFIA